MSVSGFGRQASSESKVSPRDKLLAPVRKPRAVRPIGVAVLIWTAIISGNAHGQDTRQGVLQGSIPFLTRPYSSQRLLFKIRAVLDRDDRAASDEGSDTFTSRDD